MREWDDRDSVPDGDGGGAVTSDRRSANAPGDGDGTGDEDDCLEASDRGAVRRTHEGVRVAADGGTASADGSGPVDGLREAVDRLEDGFCAFDERHRLLFANDRAASLLALGPDDAADGADARLETTDSTEADAVDPADLGSTIRAACERAMRRRDPVTVDVDDESAEPALEVTVHPSATGATVLIRDVTERIERERRLEAGNERLRSVFSEAHDAVIVFDDDGVIVDANPAAADLFGLDPSDVAGRRFSAFVPGECDLEAVVESLRENGRNRGEFPVVRADGTRRDVEYTTVANVFPGRHLSIVRDVTDRRRRERQLEEQRERLEALNHLNGVVREIIEAIYERSTRREIESVACEALADSPSYEFAFVAEVDTNPAGEQTVVERVESGVEDYLADVPISIDPDSPYGRGPASRAIRTREMQVSNDVLEDPDFEPWRDDARERGYRSAAAIPIEYEESLYGVLGLTSDRVDAFSEEEREVIGQLGEILGHAIAAVERKRALLGDELIELEYEIRDAVGFFDVEADRDDRVVFDRVVSIGDDRFLEYGTVPRRSLPMFEDLVEQVPHWDELTIIDENEDGGEATFELAISSPPMFSVFADHGGYVDGALIEGSDYTTTVHLPRRTDVREVTEEIREMYPTARVVARRQVSPENEPIGQIQGYLNAELTERQRTALETAYYAGFFEWPREMSGQEIADSLDISPATFHEHLRTAQEKIVGAVLEEPYTSSSD
ncbi:bacterio-opsin activator domain-containing protein [Natrialbaceae archaeon GCM10025810]|uniref:bacterio-opsin activator domain-containing protein n=1 Tax=Halovalidus salilacus TaxID=3075124 RepID=UPI0036136E0D